MRTVVIRLVSKAITMSVRTLRSPRMLITRLDKTTNANILLVKYLASKRNTRKLKRIVSRWRKKNRHRNSCVAFVGTALQHIGVPVPRDESIDGLAISHITLALSIYLEGHLGWERISNANHLSPGDVVFTEDATCCPGLPAHVFVFLKWRDRARMIAYAADNHGCRYQRPLRVASLKNPHAHTSTTHAPFAYALRQPYLTRRKTAQPGLQRAEGTA